MLIRRDTLGSLAGNNPHFNGKFNRPRKSTLVRKQMNQDNLTPRMPEIKDVDEE